MVTSNNRRAWLASIIGLAGGFAAGLSRAAQGMAGYNTRSFQVLGIIAFYLLLFAGAVVVLEVITRRILRRLEPATAARFRQYDALAYLPGLMPFLGAWGVRLPPFWLLALVVMVLKGVVLLAVLPKEQRRIALASEGWLAFLFLISGFAALIYQIVWQRTLFTAYGVNIESITIIVALFMFGLGLGSFAGGILAARFPQRAPELFFLCECGIGLFGLVSLPLIHWIARLSLNASLPVMSLVIFGLLCIPTMLMGATLPILVGHLYRYYHNVGRSVGVLYAINTLGSALACFLTADLLFVVTGQQGAVAVAAGCNFAVGLLVWRYARQVARQPQVDAAANPAARERTSAALPQAQSRTATRWFVVLFAAAAGYISLSQEITWMRIVSYMTGGNPKDFAHVLGFFLMGVALGAWCGKRLCERGLAPDAPAGLLALWLGVAALFYFFSITGVAQLRAFSPDAGTWAVQLAVAISSFLLGGIFTLLCHHAAEAGRSVGVTVSRVYLANILGSTLGPLLTGFVLMDRFSTAQLVLGLSLGTLLLGGLACAWRQDAWRWRGPVLSLAACGILLMLFPPLYDRLFERFQGGLAGARFKHLRETRSGVVAIQADAKGDLIFGGGVYDGRFSTDPVLNANGIRRCYFIAGLHPEPKDVLAIGLSGGAWSRVLLNYPLMNKLTVVEINPGYLDLIRQYPEEAAVLRHPKVEIAIDDGRRWLQRHPDRRFDFILQNTTFHWRSQIANLLSEEYLRLCQRRLKPDGVLYYNTTSCPHVMHTAARVFRHVVEHHNFIAASDTPFKLTPDQIRANLLRFADEGGTVFDRPETRPILEELAAARLEDLAEPARKRNDLVSITDDNMATEYKMARWVSYVWRWDVFLNNRLEW